MKIFDANISGSLNVSGAAHFFGDLTVDGVINATISGTTSNALNSDKLGGKEPSTYATTGSNTFKANQTITGSLYVSNDVVINGTSYTAATSGTSGSNGTNGSSGSNGTNGSSGTSGSNGSSGTSGSNGTNGSSGSNGTNGSSGSSGSNGTNGSSGSNGTNGSSGSNGTNGSSGSSGSNGTNGSSGSSGSNGTNGSSGSSGSNGTNGSSGTSITTSGTNNKVVKFTSTSTVGDSSITDDGTTVTIGGNLVVSGTQTTINSTTLAIGDNIIQLNGTGAANAGLVVRDATAGTLTSGSLLWDTTNDKWIAGPLGSEDDVVLRTASQTLTNKTINGSQLVDASVSNAKLASSAITIGSTSTSLGGTSTTIAGLTSLTSTALTGSLQGNISGNAATVTTNANLTGGVTSVGNATTVVTNANLTGDVTSTGNATTIGALKVTDGMLAGSISNAKLTNSSVTVTAGTGMSGGGSVALGSSVTLTNAGVTSIIAGTGISRDVATGGVTITNSGVTSAVAGTGVSVSAGTGAVTFSIGQAVGTGASVQFANGYITTGLGVGTAAPATAGLIRATNDVIAYYASDERLKENFENIPNSLDKLKQINGYTFDWIPMEGIHENEGHDIGVKAQEIEAVLPEIVTTRENGYKAVKYDRLVALLIETNKELLNRIEALEAKIK